MANSETVAIWVGIEKFILAMLLIVILAWLGLNIYEDSPKCEELSFNDSLQVGCALLKDSYNCCKDHAWTTLAETECNTHYTPLIATKC